MCRWQYPPKQQREQQVIRGGRALALPSLGKSLGARRCGWGPARFWRAGSEVQPCSEALHCHLPPLPLPKAADTRKAEGAAFSTDAAALTASFSSHFGNSSVPRAAERVLSAVKEKTNKSKASLGNEAISGGWVRDGALCSAGAVPQLFLPCILTLELLLVTLV